MNLINMETTEEQRESFREAAKPLVQWLNENCLPLCEAIVTSADARLTEGVAAVKIEEYLKD